MSAPVIRGIVFDLFDTLTPPAAQWSELPTTAATLGATPEAWDRALVESSRWRLVGEERDPYTILRRLATLIDPAIPDDLVRRALDVRRQRFAQVFRRIPAGNLETLRRLRGAGYKLALLSNADAMEIAPYQAGMLKGLFDVEVFSCDAGHAKPEPAIFHACLEALKLPASACVFAGDGGSDELRAARSLGFRTVLVTGILEAHWPDRVAARERDADHQVRWISGMLPWLGLAPVEESLTA
jgi:putative hydrolase of the HAD superfamily